MFIIPVCFSCVNLSFIMEAVFHQEPRRVERKLFFLPYSMYEEHWGLRCEGQSPPPALLSHPQLPWCFLYDEAKP